MGVIILTIFATDVVAGLLRYILLGIWALVLLNKNKLSKRMVYTVSVLIYVVLFVCLFKKMYGWITGIDNILWIILIVVVAIIIKLLGSSVCFVAGSMLDSDSTSDEQNVE